MYNLLILGVIRMSDQQTTQFNPATLGLFGFGTTTILLNICNAGFMSASNTVFMMGIFYGGMAQFIAGLFCAKQHNTFGATAFTSYGLFWWSLVGIFFVHNEFAETITGGALSAYFVIWAIITSLFAFTLIIKKAHLSGITVFVTLTILFILLAIEKGTGNALFAKIAGWEGMFCGASAVYEGYAVFLNEQTGKNILPL